MLDSRLGTQDTEMSERDLGPAILGLTVQQRDRPSANNGCPAWEIV